MTWSNADYGVSMQYPADWTANEDSQSVIVAFSSPLEGNDDAFAESVNIVMNDLSGQEITMEDYTELTLQALGETFPEAMITEASDTTLGGYPARMVVYDFNGQYGKLQALQIWTIKDEISYVVTYTALEENFDEYRPASEKMIDSLIISPIPSRIAAETKETLTPVQDSNEDTAGAAGKWRAYSEAIYYDNGGSNYLNRATTRQLILDTDGTWEFGASKGKWKIEAITDSDWEKWETSSYGPTRKIVLDGWNDSIGDGPIEESESRIDFLWLIYREEPPTVSPPGQIQIKFGHSN